MPPLQRVSRDRDWIYEFGDFRAEENARKLFRNGVPVGIEPKRFSLLIELLKEALEHPRQTVSAEELRARVWPEDPDSNVVPPAVNGARKAIGDLDRDRADRWIRNERGGYRFVVESVPVRRYFGSREKGDSLPAREGGSASARAEEELEVVGEPPFPGVGPCEEKHASSFAGRNRDIEQVQERLQSHGVAVVVGASGEGKTSLWQAGVIPAVRKELAGGRSWTPVVLEKRLGEDPVHVLARRLALLRRASASAPLDLEDFPETFSLANKIRERPEFFAEELDLIAEQASSTHGFLLVVDPLTPFVQPDEDARQFIRALVHCVKARIPALRLLLVLRSDELPHARQDPELAPILQEPHVVQIEPLTEEGYKDALRAMAEQAGLMLEPGLAERISHDAAEMSGYPFDLTMLQEVLRRLFAKRQGRALKASAYRELGGLRAVIREYAEAELKTLDAQGHRDGLTRIFASLQLGEQLENGSMSLNRAALAYHSRGAIEVPGVFQEMIRRRLVTTHDEDVLVSYIVLRQWLKEFRQRLATDPQILAVHDAVQRAAEKWEVGGYTWRRLWLGRALREAYELLEEEKLALSRLGKIFLRESRRFQTLLRTLLVLAVIAIALCVPLMLIRRNIELRNIIERRAPLAEYAARTQALVLAKGLEERSLGLKRMAAALIALRSSRSGIAPQWSEVEPGKLQNLLEQFRMELRADTTHVFDTNCAMIAFSSDPNTPSDANVNGARFDHRDYCQGALKSPDLPYVGRSYKSKTNQNYHLPISLAIFDENKKVVGLVLATFLTGRDIVKDQHLDLPSFEKDPRYPNQFASVLGKADIEPEAGVANSLPEAYVVIHHPLYESGKRMNPLDLATSREIARQTEGHGGPWTLENYVDPVDGHKHCLATLAPVPASGFVMSGLIVVVEACTD